MEEGKLIALITHNLKVSSTLAKGFLVGSLCNRSKVSENTGGENAEVERGEVGRCRMRYL